MWVYESILYTASAELPLVPDNTFYVVHSKVCTPWPKKNSSILFVNIFQKITNKNEKLFHNNN